ncbi:unnamed protein product [Rodentolepis nana]|uniref:PPPDE domain-containing protein n=1 Tax=Rodentolepis nana TaxID=102285 RepID=A0A0R3TJP7_RODNA|nr:unnamed protein product [Rodentolepis nana]
MSDVHLYIYDLSMGMAKVLSNSLVGRQFDGVWHTGVVVYNREYFFCQEGISTCTPGSLQTALLIERKIMGKTKLTEDGVQKYIQELSKSLFKPGSYELLRHNCNSFSSHFVNHLTGNQIPAYITNLPSDFLETPIGSMLKGVLETSANLIVPSSSSDFNDHKKILPHRNLPVTMRPILYDEPISSVFSPDKLTSMFAGGTGLAHQWASCALPDLLKLSSPDLDSATVSLETLSLLKFNRWATFQQCEAICEVFRIAVWRCPELILSLLTDPNENLNKLAEAFPSPSGYISKSSYLNLDASKARLLCNVLALTYDSDMSHLQFIPLEHVAALCIRLIRVEEEAEGKVPSKRLEKTPEHEMSGLALAVNFAMCPLVNESVAIEVAACLFHLLDVRRCFKHPAQACYALKAVYAFISNFSSLADLARTLEIDKYIAELSEHAEQIEGNLEMDAVHARDVKLMAEKIIQIIRP